MLQAGLGTSWHTAFGSEEFVGFEFLFGVFQPARLAVRFGPEPGDSF